MNSQVDARNASIWSDQVWHGSPWAAPVVGPAPTLALPATGESDRWEALRLVWGGPPGNQAAAPELRFRRAA